MLDFFAYGFLQRALLAGMLVGLVAPILGMHLVVRRYSLMADTLAHVSLVGVALGLLLGVSPVLGAMLVAGVAALGVERLRVRQVAFGESLLALLLSGSLALSVALASARRGFGVDLFSFLFGSITTVTWLDVGMVAVIAGGVGLGALLLSRQLFFVAYDAELAQASGVPVRLYNSILVVFAALTIAVAMQLVGVLLVSALMVVPVVTAAQYQRGFRATLWIALACSLCSVLVGLALSYQLSIPSGAAIVLVALALFLVSFLLRPQQV